ncbi:MAG: hypothetical protein ACOH1X_03840 [Kaistella sp.]
MLKVEELTYNYISKFCDFERDLVLTNHFHSDWEADILIINENGFSHELEIKFSKADFKNDFKKKYQNQQTKEKFLKHDKISCGDYPCNEFSFLLPQGMIEWTNIPENCGIIEFDHNPDSWETIFHIVRKPKRVHDESFWKFFDKDLMLKIMARNLYFKKLEVKGKFEELILPPAFSGKK